ncbi:MAG: hypothetical protein VYD19_01735, partial [Myxococcota bacterium]|nr:hypothetical protein [Myxococcota bacterium]
MIGTPAYKRPKLLCVNTYYTSQVLRVFLEQAGFQVDHLIVGSSSEEGDAIQGMGVEYHEMENVLSHKKNYIHQQAQQRQVDYLFWLDSDDFIPPALLLKTIEVATENGWWSSVMNMFIYDAFYEKLV